MVSPWNVFAPLLRSQSVRWRLRNCQMPPVRAGAVTAVIQASARGMMMVVQLVVDKIIRSPRAQLPVQTFVNQPLRRVRQMNIRRSAHPRPVRIRIAAIRGNVIPETGIIPSSHLPSRREAITIQPLCRPPVMNGRKLPQFVRLTEPRLCPHGGHRRRPAVSGSSHRAIMFSNVRLRPLQRVNITRPSRQRPQSIANPGNSRAACRFNRARVFPSLRRGIIPRTRANRSLPARNPVIGIGARIRAGVKPSFTVPRSFGRGVFAFATCATLADFPRGDFASAI